MLLKNLQLSHEVSVALARTNARSDRVVLEFFGYPAYRPAGFFFKKKSDKQNHYRAIN
jgi:hypothetical protein